MADVDEFLTFGAWVKRQRKQMGLRQEDLARQVSCSLIMIKKIEAGDRRPSRQVTELLAQHLQVAPAERERFLRLARTVTPERSGFYGVPDGALPYDLPLALTPLIGRNAHVQDVCALLRDGQARLVTLTGPGGVGKTRLGVQIAANLHDAFADGIIFVPLAAVSAPERVLPTIAQAVGLQRAVDSPSMDNMLDYLRERELLLFLDNFEQVLPAAVDLLRCLQVAPRLRLLVTSRARLQITGEWEVRVPPLDLPDLQALPAVDELAEYTAVALFVQRARSAIPGFALTEQNAPAVAEICVRLDGVPLAIELAASRCKVLSPSALLAGLKGIDSLSPLDLLASDAPDISPRQHNLRKTIEWSFNLLPAAEQILFCRLGVFVGSFSLDAARTICGGSLYGPESSPQTALEVIDALMGLVNQNMLSHLPGEEDAPRFVLLELLKEFALERLAQKGALDDLRRRHAAFFLVWVDRDVVPHFHAQDQALWLDRLEAEHDNLRAALSWCLKDSASAETGLRLGVHLWEFWLARGYVREGLDWLKRLLQLPQAGAPTRLRAQLLNGAGLLAWTKGEEGAQAWLDESLELCRQLEDISGVAWALNHLGQVAASQADYVRARTLFEESKRLFHQLGKTSNLAWVVNNLGKVYLDSGQARARPVFEEALRLFEQAGDQRGIAWTFYQFGQLSLSEMDTGNAFRLFEQCRELFHRIGDRRGQAWSTYHLGCLSLVEHAFDRAYDYLKESWKYLGHLNFTEGSGWVVYYLGRASQACGDLPEALALYAACLHNFSRQNDRWGMPLALVGAASAIAALGRWALAAQWLGAARALQAGLFGYVSTRSEEDNARFQLESERFVKEKLGETAFEKMWVLGYTAPEQAILAAKTVKV
ncbi:MAG: helix-turn-helix domain-containing protein [Chloroflexota bacterium]